VIRRRRIRKILRQQDGISKNRLQVIPGRYSTVETEECPCLIDVKTILTPSQLQPVYFLWTFSHPNGSHIATLFVLRKH
jgi:hypothetical protein